MDHAQEIRADASMFQAIPIIVQHQYVLVRTTDNRISGIVTSSDLSLQFQLLAEPFLMLSEIENHIRRLIGSKFSQPELVQARDPGATDRKVNRVEDLAFGEYLRLLENPERWAKLDLVIDRATFCKQLDRVREIRNEVMHFDPDGASPTDRETLREFDAVTAPSPMMKEEKARSVLNGEAPKSAEAAKPSEAVAAAPAA